MFKHEDNCYNVLTMSNSSIPATFWQSGQVFLIVAPQNQWQDIVNQAIAAFNVSVFDQTASDPEKVITIDEVRGMQKEAYKFPAQGQIRLCVLYNIDRAGHESANALLKVLEDTPAATRFLLLPTTHNVLPTIRSRSTVWSATSSTLESSELIPLDQAQDFATVSRSIGEIVTAGQTIELIDQWTKAILAQATPDTRTLHWLIAIRDACQKRPVNAQAILETTYLHIRYQIPLPHSLEPDDRKRKRHHGHI